MICPTHNLKYGYTCPACEEEYNYLTRSHLLPSFRAGVRGEALSTSDPFHKAAYDEGKKFKVKEKVHA